jgi:hypothetical protein
MGIDAKHITTLADATKFYYEASELLELHAGFSLNFSYDLYTGVQYVAWARSLIQNVDQGNNRRFLLALVASLISRARKGAAHARGDDAHQHHQSMVELLTSLEIDLQAGGLPSELSVPEGNPFTAKSEVREFLGQAETEVYIVDNWVGVGTLDSLRDVKYSVTVLTGKSVTPSGGDFERALQDFRAEGRSIEIRIHPKLHDRYVLFNDRCWLAGSSLKDAGKKAFNIIEVVDSKALIRAEVEKKWQESTPL